MSTYRMSITHPDDALNGPVDQAQGDAAFRPVKAEDGTEHGHAEQPRGTFGVVTQGTIGNAHERRAAMGNRKKAD